MIVGDMEIRLRADIARLQRDMDSARQVVGNATAGMERAAAAAKGALAGIAAGFGAQQFGNMIDEYAKFTAQLKLATLSQREYAAAYADVKRISTQSTQGLQETGVLYARIANGTRELGVAQKQVAAITETVNLSLLVSGATASEAASAQLQLSQAFAAGALRGEEFNAVNEAAPRLMLALADGIGVPVGALKKMAEEGQITSKIMSDVLPNALTKLREEAKEVQTISGAFTVLRNNVMEFVGVQANASGAVSGLTQAITGLANNLGTIADAGMVAAAVFGSRMVASIATGIKAKMDDIAASRAQAVANQEAAGAAVRRAQAERQTALIAQSKAREATAQVRVEVAADRERVASAALAAEQEIVARQGQFAATAGIIRQEIALEQTRLAAQINGIGRAQRTAELARLATQLAAIEKGMVAQSAALAAQRVANEQAVANAAAAGAARIAAAREAEVVATGAAAAATFRMRAASAALTAAMGAASVGATVLRGALAMLGGPIGAITLAVTLGITAWAMWANKAEEANEQALQSTDETTKEMIVRLDKQIEKLKERNKLQEAEPRVTGLNELNEADASGLARARAALEANRAAQQTADARGRMSLQLDEIELYNDYETALKRVQQAQDEATRAAERTRSTRLAEWYGQNGTAAQKMAAELEKLRKEFGTIPPEMEKIVRAKYAEKSKEHSKAMEREANLLAELSGLTTSFSEDWDVLSKAYDRGALTIEQLTAAQAKLLAEQPAMKKALEEEAAARKAIEDFNEGYAQGLAVTTKIRKDEIEAVKDQVKNNEQLVATFGMTEAAITKLEVVRLQEQLAQRSSLGLTLDEIEHLEQLIALKTRSAAALADVQALEQTRDFWTSIEQTAHDTFVSIQDGSRNMFERMKDTAKNTFFDWLYQMTLKKWIINIGTSISGTAGVSGIANAAAGGIGGTGGVGDALSLGGSLSNLYSAVTGGATVAGGLGTGFLGSLAGGLNGAGIGSGLTSALGMNIGNGIASVVGPNIASGIASGLSGLAAAAPWVAGALAVVSIGKAAFGRGPKEYTGDQTLNGSLGAGGFTGTLDAEWVKKGGWFRSDKEGSDPLPVGAEFAAGLTSAYDAIKTSSADFARVLGINADSIANRTQVIKVALGKDEAANQAAIAEFFTGVANTVAGELLPEISKFQLQGEQAAGTLERLAVNFAGVDQILAVMGTDSQTAFRAVGTASIAARERLLAFAGGIDALATNTMFFNENFLSEAERVAIIQKPLQEGLAALGFAGLTTADQFKEAVQGLVSSGALSTEEGARQYAGLLALGPQFKTVSDYLKSVGDAAAETARLAAEAAQQAEEAAKQAADAARQAALDQASSLLAGVDSAFSALQQVVDRQKRALQDEIEVRTKSVQTIQSLSQALRGSLDGMSPVGFAADDRRSAQAEIQRALAIAKASGVLPDADDLKGALSVLGQDSTSQFANREDYLRDFYATRLGIEDLAGLTDDALSVEERSLQQLEDQVKQYDLMLEREQEQIDVLKGISTIGLSIEQAIQALRGAMLAASANPVNSATSAISDAYKSALGRAPDQAGLDYWKDRAAGGISTGAIVDSIKNSPEAQIQALYKNVFGRTADAAGLSYWMDRLEGGISLDAIRQTFLDSDEKKARIPGFAGGGDHVGGWRIVGEDGPELEATGPSRIFNAGQTRDLMSRLASPVDNSTALAAAVDRLNATVDRQAKVIERQGRALDQIQRNTKRFADTQDIVTEGGKAMRTKEQGADA